MKGRMGKKGEGEGAGEEEGEEDPQGANLVAGAHFLKQWPHL